MIAHNPLHGSGQAAFPHPCGKQVASYLGLVSLEDSSGNRRPLGHITKQGSSMLRFLLVEAVQVTARSLPVCQNGAANIST
jgi:transposase